MVNDRICAGSMAVSDGVCAAGMEVRVPQNTCLDGFLTMMFVLVGDENIEAFHRNYSVSVNDVVVRPGDHPGRVMVPGTYVHIRVRP